MKVFIADDSSAIRERLRSMISEMYGISIIGEAADGQDAIDGILHYDPDVVILDLRLPKINGIEVMVSIKKQSVLSKIIIFTNYPTQQYLQRCMEEGADHFLRKTKDLEKLIRILKNYQKLVDGKEPNSIIGDNRVGAMRSKKKYS